LLSKKGDEERKLGFIIERNTPDLFY